MEGFGQATSCDDFRKALIACDAACVLTRSRSLISLGQGAAV